MSKRKKVETCSSNTEITILMDDTYLHISKYFIVSIYISFLILTLHLAGRQQT